MTAPSLPIDLKPEAAIRDYQERALKGVFNNNRARSGIVVLPCGAGKTLVGIIAACTVKRSTLVLCNSTVSVEQWYQQFLHWARIEKDRLVRFTSSLKEPLHRGACVLISTYGMIGYTGKHSDAGRLVMADISEREWGLVILDEVHVAPADTFMTCMTTRTRSRCKLGLTATLVREDGKIELLNEQVGPKLYEANWLDLQRRGFIATVSCAEVWCDMTPEFYSEYLKTTTTTSKKRLLYAMNPNKFRACQYLVLEHERRGDRVIIFSDNVFALREYADILDKPYIDGAIPQHERMRVLECFKSGKHKTILLSKVGDTSIDIPEANVIIQIASHFGARRQEAQRLGRILRPKTRKGDDFNAFFYTLISRDTQEMHYSGKRQQFLVDQGYAFKVITRMTDGMEDDPQLAFRTLAERNRLLALVMSKNDGDARRADADDGAPVDDGAPGFDPSVGGSGSGVKRKAGSMSELSGAGTLSYTEVKDHAVRKGLKEMAKKNKAAEKQAALERGRQGHRRPR